MSSIFNLVEQVKAGAGRGSKVGLGDSPTQDGNGITGLAGQGPMLNLRKDRTKRSLGTEIQGGTTKDLRRTAAQGGTTKDLHRTSAQGGDLKRQDTRTQQVRKGPRGSVCLSNLTLS